MFEEMSAPELAEEFRKRGTFLLSMALGKNWATIRKEKAQLVVQFNKRPSECLLRCVRGTFNWLGDGWYTNAAEGVYQAVENLFVELLKRSWAIGAKF